MPPIIKVRALQRGYYDKTPGEEVIRNEGEVFDYDLTHGKAVGSPGTGMDIVVSVGKGANKKDYLLPFWMERAEDSAVTITADDEVPKGHTTTHDKHSVI